MSTLRIAPAKSTLKERIVLYGTPGIGKTTFAAAAPKPLFIDLNRGLGDLPVNVVEPDGGSWNWVKLVDATHDIAKNKGYGFETLVIDLLDDAEELCISYILETVPGKSGKATSIADAGGGYGAGFQILFDKMRHLYAGIDACHRAGMRIIMNAHSTLENVKNPSGADYQRYNLKLHSKVAALFNEKADAVLFARGDTRVMKNAFDGKRFKAVDGDARLMYTIERAGHVAKNRFGLPETMALSWDDFAKECRGDNGNLLRETIVSRAKVLDQLMQSTVTSSWVQKNIEDGATRSKLYEVLNKINVKIQQISDSAHDNGAEHQES